MFAGVCPDQEHRPTSSNIQKLRPETPEINTDSMIRECACVSTYHSSRGEREPARKTEQLKEINKPAAQRTCKEKKKIKNGANHLDLVL